MAGYRLNGGQNEHVTVHEVSGFMASDVLGALNKAYALSKGTKGVVIVIQCGAALMIKN
jgi:hypothetical protein